MWVLHVHFPINSDGSFQHLAILGLNFFPTAYVHRRADNCMCVVTGLRAPDHPAGCGYGVVELTMASGLRGFVRSTSV